MKAKLLTAAALLAAAATTGYATLANRSTPRAADVKVTGDYVEARTASVFCGACHYNGELVTTGRDAILAWSFTSGRINGVDLTGLHAVAAISSDANLGDESAPRKSELAIDASASQAQADAIVAILRAKCGAQLGDIVAVRRTPITFTHGQDGYSIQASGFASMTVDYLPDNACCVQPHLVWYDPLAPLDHRKVGFTEAAAFSGAFADCWQRHGEDSSFYGSFAF